MSGEKVSLKELAMAAKAEMAPGEHPADHGFMPPVSSVTLPSRGKVYSADSPLHCADSIDIKAMTASEENILSSRALIKKGTVLTTLMRACITSRAIDPDQMLVGDRNAVLVAIRVSAYGPEYRCEVVCPACEHKFENTFDVGRLPLHTLDVDPPFGLGTNQFKFMLPVLGKEVVFQLMTGAMSAELDRTIDQLKKVKGVGAVDEDVTMRLHSQIVSLGGETDRAKLAAMVRRLPARDSLALRTYMDEISPGVDMVQKIVCPNPECNEESEVDVPLGTEFFWPSSRRR